MNSSKLTKEEIVDLIERLQSGQIVIPRNSCKPLAPEYIPILQRMLEDM